ncbi:hypothetical protein MKZ38_004947 [Zalerion maritima]|uniref:Uncharacterized protein n=1 Tax=Zalerion maritima TaxID=339359 RepID=A0AAD5WQQ3_9PEZI|nr:hypothetical protein MKZ38_004947 [Zalerion maritima]
MKLPVIFLPAILDILFLAQISDSQIQGLSFPTPGRKFQDLAARDRCDVNPTNWELYEVDQQLQANWNPGSGERFDDWIFSNYGPKTRNVECGIGQHDCDRPDNCYDYAEKELWAYYVRHSLVEMSKLLSMIDKSIDVTQSNLNSIPQSIAKDLFPWPDESKIDLQAAEIWSTAAITAMMATIIFLPAAFPVITAEAAAVVTSAATGFAVAGASFIEDPDTAVVHILQLLSTTENVGATIKERQNAQRQKLAAFSKALMSGEGVRDDDNGETILDYLAGGRFTIKPGLEQDKLNQLNFEMWISPLVNEVWKDKTSSFVMCAASGADGVPCGDATMANITGSATEGGVSCCTYMLEDDGSYGYPPKLELLADSPYDISLSHIAESSYRSYRTGGFSFDMMNATANVAGTIPDALGNQFLATGSAFPGIWTLPVCVVPDPGWVGRFEDGKLPCCCGPHCSETNTFLKVANIDKDDIRDVCRQQFPDAWPQEAGASSVLAVDPRAVAAGMVLSAIWLML